MDMECIIQRIAGGLLNPLRSRRDYGGNQLFKDDKEAFDEDDDSDDYVKPRDFISTDVRRVDGWLAEVKSQAVAALEKLDDMREKRPDISIDDVMEELDYHLTMIRTYTPSL